MHEYNPPKLNFSDSTLEITARYAAILTMLQDYECIVDFKKVNGDHRTMTCTLREDMMPVKAQLLADDLLETETNYETITVWCTDKQAWRAMKTMNIVNVEIAPKTWTLTVEEDPETGELILPLPDDFLSMQGWKEGDDLEWIDRGDGSWQLNKVDDTPK